MRREFAVVEQWFGKIGKATTATSKWCAAIALRPQAAKIPGRDGAASPFYLTGGRRWWGAEQRGCLAACSTFFHAADYDCQLACCHGSPVLTSPARVVELRTNRSPKEAGPPECRGRLIVRGLVHHSEGQCHTDGVCSGSARVRLTGPLPGWRGISQTTPPWRGRPRGSAPC